MAKISAIGTKATKLKRPKKTSIGLSHYSRPTGKKRRMSRHWKAYRGQGRP
jgi:hypothetical protein